MDEKLCLSISFVNQTRINIFEYCFLKFKYKNCAQVKSAPSSVVKLVKTTVCEKTLVSYMSESFYSPVCVLTCKEVCVGKHSKGSSKCKLVHKVSWYDKLCINIIIYRVPVDKGNSRQIFFTVPLLTTNLGYSSHPCRYKNMYKQNQ